MRSEPPPGTRPDAPGLGRQAEDDSALTTPANKARLLEAVRHAHSRWKMQARFQHIRINASVAVGSPGCLTGPGLEPFIRTAPDVANDQGAAAALRDAVARGVSECFAAWQDGVEVPGLVWYPAFRAVAAPMAAPMPNVPAPLLACPSAAGHRLSAPMLARAIVERLPTALRVLPVESAVGAMAQSLATYFSTWIVTQLVMNVLGHGPVPAFAPPAVPVGEVTGGSIISTPGHLASGGQPPMIVQ